MSTLDSAFLKALELLTPYEQEAIQAFGAAGLRDRNALDGNRCRKTIPSSTASY